MGWWKFECLLYKFETIFVTFFFNNYRDKFGSQQICNILEGKYIFFKFYTNYKNFIKFNFSSKVKSISVTLHLLISPQTSQQSLPNPEDPRTSLAISSLSSTSWTVSHNNNYSLPDVNVHTHTRVISRVQESHGRARNALLPLRYTHIHRFCARATYCYETHGCSLHNAREGESSAHLNKAQAL